MKRVALPIAPGKIDRVTFYKRDEITSDLICCIVLAEGQEWTFHEEMDGWGDLVAKLAHLSDFRRDWFAGVSQPPFATSSLVAYERPPSHTSRS